MTDPIPAGADSSQIRERIRSTRAEMDQTVDALGERLRPRHLLDDLLDVFRNKAGGTDTEIKQNLQDYGSTILGKFKHNPMPAALIGAGVVWMLFEGARDGNTNGRRDGGHGPYGRWRDEDLREYSGSFVDARTGEPYDDSYGAEFRRGGTGTGGGTGGTMRGNDLGGTTSAAEGTESSGPGMMERAKEKAADLGRSISDAASSAAGSVRDAVSGAGSAASQHTNRMGEWTSSAYGSASHGISRGYDTTRRTFEDTLNRYPLATAAAALAAGVLTGLLLPETRRENELMGEQSDRLKEQAKDAGREVMERGKEVAQSAAGAASEEAQRQGVAPGSLAEKVRHVAQDVMHAAKESAQREGLDDLGSKAKSVVQRGTEVAKDEGRQHRDEMRPM